MTGCGVALAMEIDVLTEDDAWLALPEREALAERAVRAVFEVLDIPEPADEVSVVFTSDAAMAELNRMWRGTAKPTNVLSFPAARRSGGGQPRVMGDIVLAAGVVSTEAGASAKPLANHTIHLIIHGTLHLLGHDHDEVQAAEAMEDIERRTMTRLGLPDPYEDADAAKASATAPRAAG